MRCSPYPLLSPEGRGDGFVLVGNCGVGVKMSEWLLGGLLGFRVRPCPHPWSLSRGREGGSALRDSPTHWQASQSGLSMEHASGTGAGFGSAASAAAGAALRLSSITEDTALSLPVLMVDFSVLVAARARR